jgi:hypothetical protein
MAECSRATIEVEVCSKAGVKDNGELHEWVKDGRVLKDGRRWR